MLTDPLRHDEALLSTRLVPPQLRSRVLARPALAASLREVLEARLMVVQAGTGYSKTTALASLQDAGVPLFWYTLSEADVDPQRFLAYLSAAFRLHLPDLDSLLFGVQAGRGTGTRQGVVSHTVDALLNALHRAIKIPSVLVIDDFHLVSHVPEINALVERFVAFAPPDLHVAISTRYPLDWDSLVTWRVRGEVIDVGRRSLAFSQEEIASLFGSVYGVELSPEELSILGNKTEGWPIAVQMVWQGLRDERTKRAEGLLTTGSSLQNLFSYLAKEVIGAQPTNIREFLYDTSVLRELNADACKAVTERNESADLLRRLLDLDLFVVDLGGGNYRYHHLFHDFLREQSKGDQVGLNKRHQRAAGYFEGRGDYEEALYHWLAAGEVSQAALAIEKVGDAAIQAGWLDTMAGWLTALPADVVADRPLLQAYEGDIYRLRSRFDESLRWYESAERLWRTRGDLAGVSRALRGQALVYLDTVRPAQAESILEEALALIEGSGDYQGRARILDLLAENKLNMGKPGEAEALLAQARNLRGDGPGENPLSVRVKLRTGMLEDAQRILESWAEGERREVASGQSHAPRAHRETMLMLSLINSLMGRGERAFQLAEEGIDLGARLNSPFVTAVGHTRLGHAWQLRIEPNKDQPDEQAYEQAVRCYETGMAIGDRLAVRRMRAEVMWGMTRAYGFRGNLEAAERAASEGVATGQWAGDAWIVALIELVLGASYLLAGRGQQAIEQLASVLTAFRECGDNLGLAATGIWLGLAYGELGQPEISEPYVEEALALCEAHTYNFLFTEHSFLGPPDPRRLVPLLVKARTGRRATYVTRLLAQIGLPDIETHPGYRLRVVTLGAFRVYRGASEVEARDWQRDKARQLFQLLLTQRGRWLQRDEIVERLWPALTPEAAQRDFKVALNALNKAIEPGRAGDAPFAYIERDGIAYRIRPAADLWLDSDQFERECRAGLRLADADAKGDAEEHLQAALRLYGGDYIPDALYDDWASDERERLRMLFLRAADRLAGLLVERGEHGDALGVCERILSQDACWEGAYRWMMLAYARQGNRSLALRVYQRCAQAMHAELGVEPSSSLKALHDEIARGSSV